MLKETQLVPYDFLDMMQFSNLKNAVPPPIDMVRSFLEEKIQRCCMLGRGAILVIENVDVFSKNVGRIDFQQTQEILVSEVFTKFLIEMIRCYRKVRVLLVVEKRELLNEQLNCKRIKFFKLIVDCPELFFFLKFKYFLVFQSPLLAP
jgi:hypothetical protein